MAGVASEDVLKALKKFKRLAKQDILASEQTPEPEFWRVQAEARRKVYDELMQLVQNEGVAAAYEEAKKAHAELPLQRAGEAVPPEAGGRRQALELFLSLFGGLGEGGSGTEDGGAESAGEAAPPAAAVPSNA